MSTAIRSQDDALAWVSAHAASLNEGAAHADEAISVLGAAGFFRIGVPSALGGSGGSTTDAVHAIARVAQRSLTAAFVFWGQRTFIEYLLQSDNAALRARHLPALLSGELAGATGLSNAMKFLSGIESLSIAASPAGEGWRLDGSLPWVTNLRRAGFAVAAAVEPTDGQPPAVVAFLSGTPGITRSEDLELLALRGSNTAAIRIEGVVSGAAELIHADARSFLPRVRPAFLSLQCGMSIGLARACLAAAKCVGQRRACRPAVAHRRAGGQPRPRDRATAGRPGQRQLCHPGGAPVPHAHPPRGHRARGHGPGTRRHRRPRLSGGHHRRLCPALAGSGLRSGGHPQFTQLHGELERHAALRAA
jgi:alkylation response protein AidB-like acyl-CoA dehydrogenase